MMKAHPFAHEIKYMCMNTSTNVLERFKLLKFIGVDFFQPNSFVSYKVKIAVFSKRKTSRNWKLEKRFISRSSSTFYRSKSVSKAIYCPCFIAAPERCIEWCKENNLLSSSVSNTRMETQSVGKDKVHREIDLFRDAQEKTAMSNLQSAVKFP